MQKNFLLEMIEAIFPFSSSINFERSSMCFYPLRAKEDRSSLHGRKLMLIYWKNPFSGFSIRGIPELEDSFPDLFWVTSWFICFRSLLVCMVSLNIFNMLALVDQNTLLDFWVICMQWFSILCLWISFCREF